MRGDITPVADDFENFSWHLETLFGNLPIFLLALPVDHLDFTIFQQDTNVHVWFALDVFRLVPQ